MPKVSIKANKTPASPIRKSVPYSDTAKKAGKKKYQLNIGQPYFETPASLLNTIKNSDIKVVEYSHSSGIESYRKKLAICYNSFKMPVDWHDIIFTAGAPKAMVCLDKALKVYPGRTH